MGQKEIVKTKAMVEEEGEKCVDMVVPLHLNMQAFKTTSFLLTTFSKHSHRNNISSLKLQFNHNLKHLLKFNIRLTSPCSLKSLLHHLNRYCKILSQHPTNNKSTIITLNNSSSSNQHRTSRQISDNQIFKLIFRLSPK